MLEVIGGIFLIVGILTRISAALLIIDMIGAIVLVKLPDGFVGGYELESLSVSLLLTGPGRMSIEYDALKREIFPEVRPLPRSKRRMWKESNLR
jgi:putative oxidoreductase